MMTCLMKHQQQKKIWFLKLTLLKRQTASQTKKPEIEPEKLPDENSGTRPDTDPGKNDDDDNDPCKEIEIGDDPDKERQKIPVM